MEFDLREWESNPAPVVEWLLEEQWQPWGTAGQGAFHIDSPVGTKGLWALVGLKAWAVFDGYERAGSLRINEIARGPELGTDGIRAASLAILRSRPVWRTPMGFDLILGRSPHEVEWVRSPGHWREVDVFGGIVDWPLQPGIDFDCVAPTCFWIPMRPDGLPGTLSGGNEKPEER